LDLDSLLVAAGVLAQGALAALLLIRRLNCRFRAFFACGAFQFVAGIAYLFIPVRASEVRLYAWFGSVLIDSIFYFAILAELGKNTLRHNRIAPPARWIVVLLFLGITIAIWPAGQFRVPLNMPLPWRFAMRFLQISTLLECSGFGTLVAWSAFSKLRWPDHEFRIVTGTGAWTIVSLGALMLHNDGFTGRSNHWVDLFTPGAVLIVTVWWIHHFWLAPKSLDEIHEKPVYALADVGPDH
jgi:hypothetical protein